MQNSIKKILVTGSSGQLANCIKKIQKNYNCQFYFFDSCELDITNEYLLDKIFGEIKPDFCINTAAYTNVDLAETQEQKAFLVNVIGVKNISKICQKFDTTLIHISTDYVFDGETEFGYTENNIPKPINIYGKTKFEGEKIALYENKKTIIIRTSWLYSEFGKNFVKTMISLFSQKEKLDIVCDQFGQPTNANDLAFAIMEIVFSHKKFFGIFHFSNYGETNWYEFALKIANFTNSKISLNPILSEKYFLKNKGAKRPKRSTLKLLKIQKFYNIKPIFWEDSLKNFLKTYNF